MYVYTATQRRTECNLQFETLIAVVNGRQWYPLKPICHQLDFTVKLRHKGKFTGHNGNSLIHTLLNISWDVSVC